MNKPRIAIALLLITMALAAILAGCAPVDPKSSDPGATQPAATPLPTATITPVPTREEQSVTIPAQARDVVAWAQADVARTLGIATGSVVILGVEEVAWRDSSLGCPQPGMVYLQVITPGYRILLQGGDGVYEYHASKGADRGVLCQQRASSGSRPLPTRPPSDAKQ